MSGKWESDPTMTQSYPYSVPVIDNTLKVNECLTLLVGLCSTGSSVIKEMLVPAIYRMMRI